MKKRHIPLFALIMSIALLAFVGKGELRSVENQSFQAGEKYTYKVKYGFLTIGQAKVDVHSKIFSVNNRPCYRVNVLGKTAGLASLWKVSNMYRSFIDTTAFIPHKFEYSARENSYSRDQTFTFDHKTNKVKKFEKEEITEYKIPDYVQDVISGYYYLRTVDFSKMNIGQSVKAPLFFDDKLYNMQVKYAGRDVVKTKFGKMDVLKLNPILPQNDLFEGENAIRILVSDDDNRVPIRMEIDFSFGTISMEIVSYKNVRNAFKWS